MSHDLSSAPFVICSDIHANFPALRTFISEIERIKASRVVCCGDIVGYGADPNECCDALRNRNIASVLGNHDQTAVHLRNPEYFNDIAKEAIIWTHRSLSKSNKEYLRHLPHTLREGDFLFLHASPCHPLKWDYVLTLSDARKAFACFDDWICFIGHSHQPFAVEFDGAEVSCPEGLDVQLDRRKRYLINVGSIGQPRDRLPQFCFVSVDLGDLRLRFHRLAYPVEEAQRSILDAGLPSELADRLSYGW